MSGGSFDYLCTADDPGLHGSVERMIVELEDLARDGVPGAREAAEETRRVRAEAYVRLGEADPNDAIRSVWQTVEWWRSGDWGRDRVVETLARYAEQEREPISVVYRNYRGEVATRRIRPLSVRYGATEHHPKPGWLLEVWDLDKDAARTFSLADCDFDGAAR